MLMLSYVMCKSQLFSVLRLTSNLEDWLSVWVIIDDHVITVIMVLFFFSQVAESLGISSEIMDSKYSSCLDLSKSNAYIKSEVHRLIHELVLHIHKTEPDIEKSILVFLPTYYSLEQQWRLLKPLESTFRVHILHGSIDTEQALMTMKIWKSHRKVCISYFSQ